MQNTHVITGRREWYRRQWTLIVTNASAAWQNISVPTKDLMFEDDDLYTRYIAKLYNVPYELLKDSVTHKNI